MQPVTAAVSAGSLLAGFAVADATDLRWLGGLVLLGGALWCARRWHREAGAPVTAALLGVGLAAFVLAHVLALGFGWPAYPTVLLVAAVDAVTVLSVRRATQPLTASR